MSEFDALFYDELTGSDTPTYYGNYQTAMADWIVHNKSKLSVVYASYRKHLIQKDEHNEYVDAIYIKYSADQKLQTPMECEHASTTTETIREATCIRPGLKRTYCTNCGVTIKMEEIPVIQHTLVEETAIEATCHVRGEVNTVCSECGQVLETKYTDKLPHTPETKIIREATCTYPGLEYTLCSECGELLAKRIIPTIPHKYVNGVCEICGQQEFE